MHIAQLIAAHAVAGVLKGHNLTQTLPEAMASGLRPTPQQKAVAQDLSYQTLRYLSEGQAYLQWLTSKPISDETIHYLLIVALIQLAHSQEDDFTVVNQAVTASVHIKKPWAKGLVNAILREFLRQKTSLQQRVQADEQLSLNYPKWWISEIKQQYPEHWQTILATGNAHPPMTLRVNVRKINVADYLALLAEQGMTAQQIGETAIMLEKPTSVEKLPHFLDGYISVQDAAAQWAPALLDVQAGMRVLDACSAPGGKACHLLEQADVNLTALDLDEKRLSRVADNLQRLELKATLKTGDAKTLDWFDGQLFDRIIADVPCSASGIVRRHVDMKWLRRPQDIALFSGQQAQILDNLWQTLAKGGKLLYVTCSIFHQENETQIRDFLATHADAERAHIDLNQLQQTQVALAGQLLPNRLHDGLFYALLCKHEQMD